MYNEIMNKGFTFIEILIVLVIMGIFVTITTFGIQNSRESARDITRQTEIVQLKTGLARFFADCFSFPTEGEYANAELDKTLVGISSKAPGCFDTNTYIERFPLDPESPSVNYSYTIVDSPDNHNYILCASLIDPPEPAQDISGCGSCGIRACNMKVTN